MTTKLNREQLRRLGLVEVEGHLVQRDALSISERIREYDPNLRVQYLEQPESPLDAPFRLVEKCKDGIDRIVFTFWELDERVLERIWAADTSKHNISSLLDVKNQQARDARTRRYEEKREEEKDLIQHIIKSPRVRYSAEVPVNDNETKKVVFE